MVHSSLLYFSRDDVSKLYKVSVIMERVVSEEGISTGHDKVKTVQDWPRPKTPKQMRGLSWSLLLLQEICVVTLTCSRVVAHSGSLFSSVFLS
jgi:hypothetical protein